VEQLKDHLRDLTRLSKKTDSGSTVREMLEQVEKTTGKRPPELECAEAPRELSYVYSCFLDIHRTRGVGMSGALPITYHDIKAFCEVTGNILSTRDVATIIEIDKAYLETP
jgi:hypothetical protein